MLAAGDPAVPLRVKSYTPAFFRVAADLSVDPAYEAGQVLHGGGSGLRSAFSYDARQFGQPVAESEVVATVEAVAGVVAVDLNELHRVDTPPEELATIGLPTG